jgi:hypothetical protein
MIIKNYDKEISRVLTAIYWQEENFRFENYNEGFIFTLVVYPRFMYGEKTARIDWRVRFKGKTMKEVCERVNDYYILNEPDSYYSSWIQGSPTFKHWTNENIVFVKQEFQLKSKRFTEEDERFGELLMELHRKKIQFRIENVWDRGYDIRIINPELQPSQIEIDDYNISLHPDLDVSTEKKYDDLIQALEDDWIADTNVRNLAEANGWLEDILHSQTV